MRYIGLIRSDGKVEYNARFLIGNEAAEKLELDKWYTAKDLPRPTFLKTCSQNGDDNKYKWKRVDF